MDKVVCSTITRSYNKQNDDLYALLKVDPASPVKPVKPVDINNCNFQPRNDKHYMPKRKIRDKVKTVRDIRNLFEKDVLSELPAELEKQQNYLLRKIKAGSLREYKTKSIAKNMIKCNKPLTKSSWQMLMNMNPEDQAHPMQYVLWNGQSVRVNGSKGGRSKFICNHDLGKFKNPLKYNPFSKKKFLDRKKGLLQTSLSVNFRPGPLSRKKFLDKSYQKHHVGSIDVADLPKPVLEIQPLYGIAIDPTIANFVNELREEDGLITQQWAEFAVSVLGTVKGSKVSQKPKDGSIKFDLNFKHNQTKLLMRRDLQKDNLIGYENISSSPTSQTQSDEDLISEVTDVVNGLLNAVDIHFIQDNMYTEDVEISEEYYADQAQNDCKDKPKRKYCELDRLNVTVITLSDDKTTDDVKTCQNSYCALGCICSSLKTAFTLKGHCGRIDCMFKCKCVFSKYMVTDTLDSDCSDLLPSIFNLNEEINHNLSKEEQKFRQTVVVSGDKSILLKSKKRNCKSSKKYADFYSDVPLKCNSKIEPIIKIVQTKLNCENIEPWCMVHNLYKCFCKGIFTETSLSEEVVNDLNKKLNESSEAVKESENGDIDEIKTEEEEEEDVSWTYTRSRKRKSYLPETDLCAKVKPYEGRKFSNGYYKNAYRKLQEMEVNDSNLRERLVYLINKSISYTEQVHVITDNEDNSEVICEEKHEGKEHKKHEGKATQCKRKKETNHKGEENTKHVEETKMKTRSTNPIQIDSPKTNIVMTQVEAVDSSTEKHISNKPKLVAWLETSYQHYKRRLDMGVLKNILEPPKQGKVALYPWDFILSRYSERKNLFLVSKVKPHRIFMAVNSNNPLFENCINIDDIRFADLNKYPTTVKNLLTNTSGMNDYFCILYGYKICWEFIGTVTKIDSTKQNKKDSVNITPTIPAAENNESNRIESPKIFVNYDTETSIELSSGIPQMSPYSEESLKQSESSKWFIMTVENDFSEIQFYNRGFFVKHESILKAINVARMSGKTVRLSSQKCANQSNGTQFGIYAIPNANEYCVFIGPYETTESLGVETIKTAIPEGKKQKRTRGVWITTDKVDNMKVIDDPLSFMPSQKIQHKDVVSVGREHDNNDTETAVSTCSEKEIKISQPVSLNDSSSETTLKTVKPIKIRKTNGFFQLSSNSVLKPVSVLKSGSQPTTPGLPATVIINTTGITAIPVISDLSTTLAKPVLLSLIESQPVSQARTLLPVSRVPCISGSQTPKRPVAEVAPQIKISSVYSECFSEKNKERTRKEGGMFILQPQEINEKIQSHDSDQNPEAGSSKLENSDEDDDMAMDIEHFLDTSQICTASENETFVISDDDEAPIIEKTRKVFIGCTNIENLGAISGEIDQQNRISFRFPGFKSSEFYEKDEVFEKINQVMSRKVYIPENLTLEWHIVEAISELRCPRLLEKEEFIPCLIMTTKGMRKKTDVAEQSSTRTFMQIKTDVGEQSGMKTYINKNKKIDQKITSKRNSTRLDQIHNSSIQFEDESQLLDDENEELVDETISNKMVILKSISEASDADCEQFTNVLKGIESMTHTIDD